MTKEKGVENKKDNNNNNGDKGGNRKGTRKGKRKGKRKGQKAKEKEKGNEREPENDEEKEKGIREVEKEKEYNIETEKEKRKEKRKGKKKEKERKEEEAREGQEVGLRLDVVLENERDGDWNERNVGNADVDGDLLLSSTSSSSSSTSTATSTSATTLKAASSTTSRSLSTLPSASFASTSRSPSTGESLSTDSGASTSTSASSNSIEELKKKRRSWHSWSTRGPSLHSKSTATRSRSPSIAPSLTTSMPATRLASTSPSNSRSTSTATSRSASTTASPLASTSAWSLLSATSTGTSTRLLLSSTQAIPTLIPRDLIPSSSVDSTVTSVDRDERQPVDDADEFDGGQKKANNKKKLDAEEEKKAEALLDGWRAAESEGRDAISLRACELSELPVFSLFSNSVTFVSSSSSSASSASSAAVSASTSSSKSISAPQTPTFATSSSSSSSTFSTISASASSSSLPSSTSRNRRAETETQTRREATSSSIIPNESLSVINLRQTLTVLDLSRNKLRQLSPSISHLQSLTKLNVSHNLLTRIPNEISELSRLKSLDVSHNLLRSLPVQMARLDSLVQLCVCSNFIASIPTTIGQLYRLAELKPLPTDSRFVESIAPNTTTTATSSGVRGRRRIVRSKSASTGQLKVVVVGDLCAGKSELAAAITQRRSGSGVNASVKEARVKLNGKDDEYVLSIFDTTGQEEFDNFRQMSYDKTSVFIVCFSVMNPESCANVLDIWFPEIHALHPQVPVILVGTHIDQRDHQSKVRYQDDVLGGDDDQMRPVTFQEGQRLAQDMFADAYVECSTRTSTGVAEVFQAALRAVVGEDDEVEVNEERKSGKRFGPFSNGAKPTELIAFYQLRQHPVEQLKEIKKAMKMQESGRVYIAGVKGKKEKKRKEKKQDKDEERLGDESATGGLKDSGGVGSLKRRSIRRLGTLRKNSVAEEQPQQIEKPVYKKRSLSMRSMRNRLLPKEAGERNENQTAQDSSAEASRASLSPSLEFGH